MCIFLILVSRYMKCYLGHDPIEWSQPFLKRNFLKTIKLPTLKLYSFTLSRASYDILCMVPGDIMTFQNLNPSSIVSNLYVGHLSHFGILLP